MDSNASLVATHVGSTLMVVGGMQALKSAKWFPLVRKGATYFNRAFSVAAAFLVQVGISYTWSTNTNGTYNLLFVIPSATAIAIAVFHWASQYIYQETGYQVLSGLLALKTIANGLESTMVGAGGPGAEAALQVTPVAVKDGHSS